MNLIHKKALAGKTLVDKVVEEAHEELAENAVILDLSDVPASSAQWFIICDGSSTVHCQAIYNRIVSSLRELDTPPWVTEGFEDGRWILIDYSDVIVHIMLPELRQYYELESLWAQGKRVVAAHNDPAQNKSN